MYKITTQEVQDWNIFREWLKDLLQIRPEVEVTFTKKDGTERVMKCTLHPDILPKQEVKENNDKVTRIQNESVLPVYDLEVKSWRSFTVDSVREVKVTA
jgi:hypothetical protein